MSTASASRQFMKQPADDDRATPAHLAPARGLAWLERQAEAAEELVAQRKRMAEHRSGQ